MEILISIPIWIVILLLFFFLIRIVFSSQPSSEEKAMKELVELSEKEKSFKNAKKHSQKKFKRKC